MLPSHLNVAAVVLLIASAPMQAQDLVVSGPQPGEVLPPLNLVDAFDEQSSEFDPVSQANGAPLLLVFIHDLLANKSDEPSLGLAHVLMQYAGHRQESGLARCIVCTTDDMTSMRTFLKNIRRVFPKNKTPIGISPDGVEGPGSYGLNRSNVRMTILIAKDDQVTASFALTQPSIRTDAPRILAELSKVIVGQPPHLWQLDFPYFVSPFQTSKVITSRGGIHSTTRGTIRLVAAHNNRWLVFHGNPNMVHFSTDGIQWVGREIPEFSGRNYLMRGDTIYSFARVASGTEPLDGQQVTATFSGTIHDRRIDWGDPHLVSHLTLAYYEDLQQDSHGHFTVSGRVVHRDAEAQPTGITIEWARSVRPDDISQWHPQKQAIQHTSDMKSSEVHENIPLEDGKSYLVGMLSVNGQGRLYGNLFDGQQWRERDTLLAENMSTVRGTDKRMSAVWDARTKVIHLTYVDHESQLWYRSCRSPYRTEDWTKPDKLKPFKVFTNVMSIDSSLEPARVVLLYGKTEFEHRDPRWQSGSLFLTKFDGRSWSDPVIVSEPGTKDNWYPNMNLDASQGIGVLYLKGVPENQAAIENSDFDIMFSSTGQPITSK